MSCCPRQITAEICVRRTKSLLFVVLRNRRRVRSDCSLGAQSLPGDLPTKKRAPTTDHFCHTIAGNSPFRIDGIAKRNRTDHKGQSWFWCKILCWSFAICNLRTPRGLEAQTCTEGSNPPLSAMQSELQRKPCLSFRSTRGFRPFLAISTRQIGPRRTDYGGSGARQSALFLCNGDKQSDFDDFVRRRPGDQESNYLREAMGKASDK